ncbi:hypothetical protein [Acetobacter sp. UBA5411]|uniref:hypothetical protein n=1 Tax=Acetobacter sp. UBA5411 TaxID=1945905 RepID=UPI0025BEC543|nr:hypothetical protein [Acetobacter sp. UBA5411]
MGDTITELQCEGRTLAYHSDRKQPTQEQQDQKALLDWFCSRVEARYAECPYSDGLAAYRHKLNADLLQKRLALNV